MKLLMGLFACFAVASAQKCGGADVTGSGGGKPDGIVNIEDLIGLLSAFGSAKSKDARYDLVKGKNGKQLINIEDLLKMLENFGAKNCKSSPSPPPPPSCDKLCKLKKCCKNGVQQTRGGYACKKGSGACSKLYRPVCGCDGATYSNAGCAGHSVKSSSNGACGGSGGGGGGDVSIGRPFLTTDTSREWGVKALLASATADTAADWIGL